MTGHKTQPRVAPLDADALALQILDTWRRNNEILLNLLDEIPDAGLEALPAGSRGRDVRAVFSHLDRVRRGWLVYHTTGKRPSGDRYDKAKPPTKAQLAKALGESGESVARFIDQSIRQGPPPRMFAGRIVRWMGYLIAHDSHHRGQIALALKQSGMKLSTTVAYDGLWGKWMFGK